MRKLTACIGVIVSLGLLVMIPSAIADTAGPSSPGTIVSDNTVGTGVWANPGNAASQNDTNAGAPARNDGNITEYLKATNFGFSIPAGSTINGITVEVDKFENGINSPINDHRARLVKAGTIQTTDKSQGAWPTSDTDTYTTYGGAADLWGTTWTVDDINDSGFGFAIAAINASGLGVGGSAANVFVDHIRITVTYTAGGGGGAATVTHARRIMFY